MSLDEVRKVLECFDKDKNPGPNGWTLKIFLGFFDVMEGDLLDVVEESRTSEREFGGLNATFISFQKGIILLPYKILGLFLFAIWPIKSQLK